MKKGLYGHSVKGWCTVEKHWVLFYHFFQAFPNLWCLLLYQLLGVLYRSGISLFFQSSINKGFE